MKTKKKDFTLFILVMVLFVMNDLSAQTLTRTFTFNFMPEDFELSGKDEIEILPGMRFYEEWINFYYGELRTPALLYFEYPVLIPDNYKMKDFTYTLVDEININRVVNGDDTLEMDNIILAPTPIDISGPGPHPESPDYPLISYPAEVIHSGKVRTDGFKPESFMINPFTYHAAEGKLNLTTSITLTITIEPDSNYQIPDGRDDDAIEFIKWYVCNPEDVEKGIENWTPTSMDIAEETVSWVGATWSYYMYDYYPSENYYPYENDREEYSFFRYTVLDRPEVLDGKTYYPLVWYSTCEYEEDHKGYRIRQEGKKVLIRKEDFNGKGILKEIGDDYVLYDFSLNEGDEYCKYNGSPLTVREVDTIQDERGQTYRQLLFQSSDGWETWIDGIGSTLDLLIPYTYPQLQRWYWHRMTLNYFCSADSSVIYRNPRTKGDVMYPLNRYELANRFDHFKEEDCSLNPSRIKGVTDCSPIYVRAYNSKIHCTSPNATKLEVYTMDAQKVGEARFVGGEASVKVSKTPATYLYIVTYPDGRRESGKIVVKG